jgi:tetratricopeptide (TPR) repeat protein
MKTCIGRASGLAIVLWMWGSAPPAKAADTQIQILSATVRDQKIDGATVILQKNGQQSVATTTAADGLAHALTSDADDPSTLLIVRKPGYSDLVAKCPCAGMTYAISPVMTQLDSLRVVLNWNRRPEDLDAHLGFARQHVYFMNKNQDNAQLDVDDTTGFGPETVTLYRRQSGMRYVYSVQSYTNRLSPDSRELASSGARVYVYVGRTLIRTYNVPAHGTGNLWTVFAVSEAGELQDIDTMSGIYVEGPQQLTIERIFAARLGAPGSVGSPPRSGVLRAGVPEIRLEGAPPPPPPATIPEYARDINVRGESAYRAGEYERAAELFRAAIDAHATYGQAYSNLGLTFQKLGRRAEALWTNRKAIALASGATAHTVRASTHFNNGRIYENAGQWSDALREYESAFREKRATVYENAIERMRKKGSL